MESQFWKQILKSQFRAPPSLLSSSSSISWEEKAFAEDTSGPLGGSVWPPRSYACNFCMREFRSAQALGGHMNVHRRDRARLQQSHLQDQTNLSRSLMGFKNNSIFTSASRVSTNQSAEWSDSVGFSLVNVEKKKGGGGDEEEGLEVETDLSMNSFVSLQNRSPSGFCGNEVVKLSSKRPKISNSSVSFCDVYSSGSTEELDLELRLAPKVN